MATTNPTRAEERDARVHQLAAKGLSNRAIGRELGIAHTTVARILRTTTAPAAPPERTRPAPPTATSGKRLAPRLLHPLPPELIQDLNVLADPRTGQLPAPLVRAIRAAADHRRTTMRTRAEHRTTEVEPTP